jgi:GT2 family glycosyltransferase
MEQFDFKTIGIGITTYNSPSRLDTLLKTIPDFIENIIIINDGTPYDNLIYQGKFDVIQFPKNRGVASAKNAALRYLMGQGCEHIFLLEDDIIIKDTSIFLKYIESSKISGIKHFNYALQGYGNANRYEDGTINHPTPVYCVSYKDIEICFYHWCSGPLMYMHRDCIDKVGYLDEKFFNIHEHVDFTYRIIKEELHPPFWYFADIANAHHYIGDGTEFRNTTIKKDDKYGERLRGADIYFSIKHGHKPLDIPKSTTEELLLSLLKLKI